MVSSATPQRGLKRRILDGIRQFNKHVYNPTILRIVRFVPFYAVINHAGRRSGKAYRTPIALGQTPQYFYIPLPYGDHVDWHRNIQASGQFVIEHLGRRFTATYDIQVGDEEALPTFGGFMRRGLRRAGVRHYVRARRG
jgi:deazaflavin-dependent oxidoreductase (nitroreductase family)